MKLSIVIPCYNEAKNIPLILEEYKKVIIRNDIEIILVNNNSSDESAEVLRRLLPNYSFAKTVFEPTPGYGSAVLCGLRESIGEYIGWTHGDMQTPPNDIIRALEIIEKSQNPQSLYVKGNRKGRPMFDFIFTFGMSIFESIYFGKLFYDINAQPNIFHRNFFEQWKNPPTDFSLDLYVYYQASRHDLKIVRFPVIFPPRIHGESSWNTGLKSKWKFIKRTISFSAKLKKTID